MATYLTFGGSANGGAVTVTIPSASNIGALMVWYYEDAGGSAGNAPTVPGGATATLVSSPTFFRAGRAYVVTGLSAGSNTFTPPASGGSQWCVVVVFGDVDQTTPTGANTGAGASYFSGSNINLSTPNVDDECLLFVGSPTGNPSGAATGGSTLIGTISVSASYGGRVSVVRKTATGSSTDIAMTATGSAWSYGVVLNTDAGGGGGPTTVGAQVMMVC